MFEVCFEGPFFEGLVLKGLVLDQPLFQGLVWEGVGGLSRSKKDNNSLR